MRAVKVIVVTGGIASGKSTVISQLAELGGKGTELFDCDAAVAELQQSGRLSRDLVSAFGADALDAGGNVNKDFLRDIVKNDAEGRAKLDGIVHPKLAQMCCEAQAEARRRGDVHTFLVDIPLYFESPVEFGADVVCVVAVSEATQIARLMTRDGIGKREAKAFLAAQMPTQEKIDKASVVFWNEGSEGALRQQVEMFYATELAAEAKAMQARSVIINLNELRRKPLGELQTMAREKARKGADTLPRPELLADLVLGFLQEGNQVIVSGVLEMGRDNVAMLRDPARSFRPGADDARLPGDLLRRYNLRPGNALKVKLRAPRGKQEKQIFADTVLEIEGTPAEDYVQPKDFEHLTPLIPRERLMLENPDIKAPAMRVLDLITPLGMGQRALVVAPPRGGKTVLLKTMAKSLRANYPKAELLVLLLDERPEEVTDFEETVDVPVYASTFDEPSKRHAQLSDLLRYALYDSDKATVQLSDDVAFMENYIGLMKLRCNELASVTTSFDVPQGSVEVAPLLFISLIENAFKHGVNARKPSFVDISLGTEGSDLVFVCSNSLFEKQKEERIGSGIGLENMLRRLELIYGKDGFDYNVRTEGDMYCSEVRLKGIA